MEGWKDTHHRLWPGIDVPKLLCPVQSKNENGEKFFQEQTVPTSLMISIFVFAISQVKRNAMFRKRASPPLIDIIVKCCHTGKLKLTLPLEQAWSLDMPSHGKLPLACFLTNENEKNQFLDDWDWMLQDPSDAQSSLPVSSQELNTFPTHFHRTSCAGNRQVIYALSCYNSAYWASHSICSGPATGLISNQMCFAGMIDQINKHCSTSWFVQYYFCLDVFYS